MLPIRGRKGMGKTTAETVKAPRSKGCRVCVQRRIKCDQTRPYCQRCRRANRECPGFETTKFVDEGPTLKALYDSSSKEQSRERHPSQSSTSSSSSIAEECGGDDSSSVLLRKAPTPKRKSITAVSSENWHSGAFERNAIISIICPTAYQNQLLADFITSMRQPVQAPTFRCHSMWLREVALRSNAPPSLLWAVRAISLSHLGRRISDPHLIETSRRMYGKALLKLNAALQDPLEGLSSDTLSATVLLSFYEIFNCTDRHSWIKHAGGAGHLIRLRGPARHRYGPDRTIFIACRHSLIMEAFQTRTPCFLSAPDWRALGWSIHRDIKAEHPGAPMIDSNEHFFQEMVAHPAYLRAAIKAVTAPAPDPVRLLTLFKRGQDHRTNYQRIYARLTQELQSMGMEPTKTASSFNDTTFPVVYDYPGVHIGSLYCGYWAVLCGINISLIGLQAKIAKATQSAIPRSFTHAHSVEGSPGESANQPNSSANITTHPAGPNDGALSWDAAQIMGQPSHLYIAETSAYAREICKSAEFMQQTPFLGPLFLVLALRIALRMGISPAEKAWVLRKLDHIGDEMGLAKLEVENYHQQRGDAVAREKGGPGSSARAWRNNGAAEGGRDEFNSRDGVPREMGDGGGIMGFVEREGWGLGAGSGIEAPGMGGVLPDEAGAGGIRGKLAPAPGTAPVVGGNIAWDSNVLDPRLAAGSVGGGDMGVGGWGWGQSATSGYPAGSGFVAQSIPVDGVAMEGVGMLSGLETEWQDSAGQWKGGGLVSGV